MRSARSDNRPDGPQARKDQEKESPHEIKSKSHFGDGRLRVDCTLRSANPAAAQQTVCKGNFTLPYEVRWQGNTLPAGDYTFSMRSFASPKLIQIQGPNGGIFVMPVGTSQVRAEDRSRITIELRGGSRFVRDLYLAEIGIHLRYSVPKAPKEELLAQAPEASEQVFVATSKK